MQINSRRKRIKIQIRFIYKFDLSGKRLAEGRRWRGLAELRLYLDFLIKKLISSCAINVRCPSRRSASATDRLHVLCANNKVHAPDNVSISRRHVGLHWTWNFFWSAIWVHLSVVDQRGILVNSSRVSLWTPDSFEDTSPLIVENNCDFSLAFPDKVRALARYNRYLRIFRKTGGRIFRKHLPPSSLAANNFANCVLKRIACRLYFLLIIYLVVLPLVSCPINY